MGAVTPLPRSRPLTRDDLETMPDDGHRYELIDGVLVVTPAPSNVHQTVSVTLSSCSAARVRPTSSSCTRRSMSHWPRTR